MKFEDIKKEVLSELDEEQTKKAKLKLKEKIKQLQAARKIVKNLERELVELEHEISEGL